MYTVVGRVQGDTRYEEQIDISSPVDVPAVVPEGACPFTGETSGACPLGFGAKATPSSHGECPWPFVMLHDPCGGWAKHRKQNILGACVAVAAIGIYAASQAT